MNSGNAKTSAEQHERIALLLDIFIIANLVCLAVDVFVAHAANEFARKSEWLPCIFALLGALLLTLTVLMKNHLQAAYICRLVVSWMAIFIGIAGMLLHLHSRFFVELTLKSLVYTAPFVAPLAFSGVGLLLLLTVSIKCTSLAWGQWVVFLAGCGWVGNFLLSVLDHAQNGFFNPLEWLPVGASAFAIGALLVAVVKPRQRHSFAFTVLALNTLLGIAGFVLHLIAAWRQPGPLAEKFLYGAPLFAPLLFVDLAILAALGLWQLCSVSKAQQSLL